MEANTDNSTTKPKIKRVKRDSRGNVHLLQQQAKKQRRREHEIAPEMDDMTAYHFLNELRDCGCQHSQGSGCILASFARLDGTVDYRGASDLVISCHNLIRLKDSEEKRRFLIHSFRSCIDSEILLPNGNKRFVMKYTLGGLSQRKLQICKTAFAKVYQTTVSELESISARLKLATDGSAPVEKISKFDDETVLDYTYTETEAIFQENLGEPPGRNLFVFNQHFLISLLIPCLDGLDPYMVRAALQPFSQRQQMCRVWMEDYFKTFGDHQPNSEFNKLSVLTKRDVYDTYKQEFAIKHSPARPVVGYSTFTELWNVMFPYVTIRPFVDVPGKCDICFEIDRLRRSSGDRVLQDAARKAHQLHRGGFFMPERLK